MMDAIWPILLHVISYTTLALTAFIQPSSYLYWPYTLSTLLLAYLFGKSRFFNAKDWWHPSARQDYKLYIANFIILPPLFTALYLNESAVIGLLNHWFGSSAAAPMVQHDWGERLAFTIAIFVVYDFGRFVAHWLLHRIPSMWEIHKVHHSATVLTPMTAYRVHPVETLIMNGIPLILTGLTAWLFNRILGVGVTVYVFLGMHVLLALLNFVDNLRHSSVWITYGSTVGRWIISPAHHQLHHSLEERHLGCNLGFCLAVWDRLAGSLYVPTKDPEAFRLGIDAASASHYTGLVSLYLKPLVASVRSLFGFALPRHEP